MPTPDGQSLQAPQSPQRREPPTRGSPNPGRWAAPLPGQGGPDCVPSSRARTTGRPKGPQRGGGHVFPEVPPHQCPSACGPQPHPLPPLPGTTSSDPGWHKERQAVKDGRGPAEPPLGTRCMQPGPPQGQAPHPQEGLLTGGPHSHARGEGPAGGHVLGVGSGPAE